MRAMKTLLTTVPSFALGALLFGGAAALGVEHYATVSCSSAHPCQTYANSSSGSGVASTSAKGNGLLATTAFASTNQNNGQAGVLGEDLSTSGVYDSGVRGMSTNGAGVIGVSAASNTQNSSYTIAGVSGFSNGASYGIGVAGYAKNGFAVYGKSSNSAIYGQSTGGSGVEAHSSAAGKAALFAQNSVGGPVMWLDNPAGTSTVMDVESNGNVSISGGMSIAGSLTVGGGCSGCAKLRRRVRSYAATASAPTLEDFGEAAVHQGAAHVDLDATYARAIAQRPDYLVFITPEGDSRGLFVTNKSLEGFDVREAQGGRSSLAFSYRIVARPFGSTESRLPLVAAR